MNLALILVVLPRAAGIFLGPIPPRLRVPAISAWALPIFVASLFRLVPAYPGTADVGRWFTSAGSGPGSPLFTAVYLVPPVLPTAVLVCLSVLWPGADLR